MVSNFDAKDIHKLNGNIIWYWKKQAEEEGNPLFHRFISAWISFNAIYFPITKAWGDKSSWKEFLKKQEIEKIWTEVRYSQEIIDFNWFLRERKRVIRVNMNDNKIGWIVDMKNGKLHEKWNFWDDFENYIWVIYQIRNNLFHWWKEGTDSDKKLVESAHNSFMVFLNKCIGLLK